MGAAYADDAGLPGHCCVCGRRWRIGCLCLPCLRRYTDAATGQLAPWVAELRRLAKRQVDRELARRAHLGRRSGRPLPAVTLVSLDRLLAELEAGDPGADGRRLTAVPASLDEGLAPAVEVGTGRRRAPSLARWVESSPVDIPLVLRQYTASGVPLDMPGFLGLLLELGWPPPGTRVDRRFREEVVDLYCKVYQA